jgi:hypothetical protein
MNQYPRGKLNDTDEGALPIAVGVQDQTVIINFGKKVRWIGMSKPEAIQFATVIMKHAGAKKIEVEL